MSYEIEIPQYGIGEEIMDLNDTDKGSLELTETALKSGFRKEDYMDY